MPAFAWHASACVTRRTRDMRYFSLDACAVRLVVTKKHFRTTGEMEGGGVMQLEEHAITAPSAQLMLVALLVTLAQAEPPAGRARRARRSSSASRASPWRRFSASPRKVPSSSSSTMTAIRSPGACKRRRAGTRSRRSSSTLCGTGRDVRCCESSSPSRVHRSTPCAEAFASRRCEAARSSPACASAKRSSPPGVNSRAPSPTGVPGTTRSTAPSRATRSGHSTLCFAKYRQGAPTGHLPPETGQGTSRFPRRTDAAPAPPRHQVVRS